MSGHLAGTGALVRLVLRRDRLRLAVWVLAIVAVVYASAAAVVGTYGSPEAMTAYARNVGTSPTAVVMAGPPVALNRIGGILVFETELTAYLAVALMAAFLVVRHTRAEEENGRTELLRSTVVGVHAHLAAATLVTGGACVLVGAGVLASLTAVGAPVVGSLVYGAAVTAFGLVFTALTAIVAQVFTHARGALGATGALVAVAFVLRGAGDVRENALVWFSPMGWSQQVRAFGADRWWPLLVSLGFVALCGFGALALARRRDVGAGLVAARPGPPRAGAGLGTAAGLLLRLQRGSLVGWSVGLFLGGLSFGSVSRELEAMVEDNPALASYFADAGGTSLVESFFSVALLLLSLIAAGFAVSSALRTRSEENGGRLEPVLATGVSRTGWLGAGLLVTVVGSVLVVAAGGLGMGLAQALVASDPSAVLRLTGQSLVYAPAVLAVASVAVLLLGWAPRAVALTWAVVAFAFVVGYLGNVIDFWQWVRDLSPFTHTPAVPADPLNAAPLAAIGAVAVLVALAGLVGFRRRDVATSGGGE